MKLVPHLRFKEFKENWTEFSLETVCSKIQDGTHFSPKTYDEGKFLYLTSKNIKKGYIDLSNVQYISEADHIEIYKRCSIIRGDVLLSKDGTIGQVCVNELDEPFSLLSSVAFLRPNEKFSNYFLYQVLVSPIGQREIGNSIAGQALKRITLTKINSFKYNFPTLPEQQKIASFLSAVDERVQQLKRKKELLEHYKKGLMQQLFSGKLRFKNENGKAYPKWEEKRLGDVADIKRGGSPRPITDPKWFDSNSKVGWVRISDVTRSNKYLNETVQYLSKEGIEKSRLVREGSMIMSICATIGKPIYTKFEVCIHDGFVVFENLQADKEFLYYYLDKIQLGWYRYGQPGSQVNLNIDIVSNETMPYPSKAEQQKIASYLSSIDTKIESVTTQIAQSQTFKKGLLQQMFV